MKCVLVTGVSQGLGLEITRVLLAGGYHVVGMSRRETPELTQLRSSYQDRFGFAPVDLNETDQIETHFKALVGREQPLHGLVNNAAVAYDDLVTNLSMPALQQMYAVNVLAPLLLTKLAIRNMLLHGQGGSIVHVSSVCAHRGYKGLAMYASTKGALEAFSLNTAREWGGRNIRSNCVAAGFMETAMSSKLDAEQRSRIAQRAALQALTEPRSVAETVAFLLGDGAASITGQTIRVDAGTI